MPSGGGKLYGPVGRCIYCLKSEPPLTDEHIMPAGLGGEIILESSSCTTCQKEINENIENPAMQRMFREVRYRLGLGGRRKNKRPQKLSLKVPIDWERDGSQISSAKVHDPDLWKSEEVAYEQHFTPVALYNFDLPGILRGLSPPQSHQHFVRGVWSNHLAVKDTPKTAVYVETEMNQLVQLKLIAKIAHGFAVFRYGVDGFIPFLPNFILGKEFPYASFYVGGDWGEPPKQSASSYIRSSRLGSLILVRVRIFASAGAPIYTAVVGKHKEDSARLTPYGRADGK